MVMTHRESFSARERIEGGIALEDEGKKKKLSVSHILTRIHNSRDLHYVGNLPWDCCGHCANSTHTNIDRWLGMGRSENSLFESNPRIWATGDAACPER